MIGSKTVLTANGFVRHDHLTYTPSADPFADTPATVSQDRTLTNFGVKVDVDVRWPAITTSSSAGRSRATKLHENFTFGITDPDRRGRSPTRTATSIQALAPFDLTNGGSTARSTTSRFDRSSNRRPTSRTTSRPAMRRSSSACALDHYDGLTSTTLVQPRLGVSYAVPGSGTVLRASYGRTMETPYNENLLLSSGCGAERPVRRQRRRCHPARATRASSASSRRFGRWVVVDFGYFNKHTDNAYDFGVLFDTPIAFPIAWDHSRIDGFTGRINLVEHDGFSAFVVMAHTNAIFSPPGVGGILLEEADGRLPDRPRPEVQRDDQPAVHVRQAHGAWAALIWRYDSGLVAGAVGSLDDALALTADQQAAIGFFCGSTVATRDAPLTDQTARPRTTARRGCRFPPKARRTT